MPDELDKLFVSDADLNKGLLFEILNERVKIMEDSNILIIGDFPPIKIILLYALSKKVMFIKNKADQDSIGPKEITEKTGIAEGTSKVYVRKLEKMGFLLNKGGKYIVPNFALNKIKDFLLENGQDK